MIPPIPATGILITDAHEQLARRRVSAPDPAGGKLYYGSERAADYLRRGIEAAQLVLFYWSVDFHAPAPLSPSPWHMARTASEDEVTVVHLLDHPQIFKTSNWPAESIGQAAFFDRGAFHQWLVDKFPEPSRTVSAQIRSVIREPNPHRTVTAQLDVDVMAVPAKADEGSSNRALLQSAIGATIRREWPNGMPVVGSKKARDALIASKMGLPTGPSVDTFRRFFNAFPDLDPYRK